MPILTPISVKTKKKADTFCKAFAQKAWWFATIAVCPTIHNRVYLLQFSNTYIYIYTSHFSRTNAKCQTDFT